MELLSLALLGWLVSTCQAQSSIQSGPNVGALYAAGMVYDEKANELLLTGISYDASLGKSSPASASQQASSGSSCMVAKVPVPNMSMNDIGVFGSADIIEACRSIAILNDSVMVVVGTSDPGGLYAAPDKVQSGFGMAIDRSSFTPLSGASLFADQVPYPQSIVTDGYSMTMYVASMTSNENDENDVSGDFPNWTYPNKHDQHFEITIKKLSLSQGSFEGVAGSSTQFQSEWMHYFLVK